MVLKVSVAPRQINSTKIWNTGLLKMFVKVLTTRLATSFSRRKPKWFLSMGLRQGSGFNVLLTVHLSIFLLIINQFDAQNLFYNKFISCLNFFFYKTRICTLSLLTNSMHKFLFSKKEAWNKLILKQILCIKFFNY